MEKAEKTLTELLKKNPSGGFVLSPWLSARHSDSNYIDATTINAEIMRIRAVDAERQKKQDKKLRGRCS